MFIVSMFIIFFFCLTIQKDVQYKDAEHTACVMELQSCGQRDGVGYRDTS